MTLEEIRKSNRRVDLFCLARYFYRIGEPIMDDSEYERLTDEMHEKYADEAALYLNQTYDDDEIPYKLLNEIGVEPTDFSRAANKEDLFQYFNSEKSLSINSVTNYEDAYAFFSKYRAEHQDLMTSLKMDGDNVKTLYLDGELKLSLSRGRSSGVSFDFTNTVKNVFPLNIKCGKHECKVYAEAYVESDYLQVLRDRYNPNGYKTCKSAAISLLRVPHAKEDYEHLKIILHSIEGVGNTMQEEFDKAKELGFDVVKHKLIPWQDIPENYQEFRQWLKESVFDHFEKETVGIPSDGVVVEVNDLNYTGIESGQYTSRQLALKFEQWSFKCYKGVIEDILWEQKRVQASCRIRIKPMLTDDGCSAEYINGFNFAILVQENLNIGSEVYYVRNSGAVNILVYGKELDNLLGR